MGPTAGLAGLFLWSFLAATILPLGSEPALVALVRSSGSMVVPILVATLGNVLGAATTWWLGRKGGEALDSSSDGSRWDRRARTMFARWGQPALLLSWVPLVGDAIVAVAGASGVRFGPFALWTTSGKLARYAAVAWATGLIGS